MTAYVITYNIYEKGSIVGSGIIARNDLKAAVEGFVLDSDKLNRIHRAPADVVVKEMENI